VRNLARFLVFAGCAARIVAAQDERPEVALLRRITNHALQELSHLPDCTCLETLERSHRPAGITGRPRALDTVRMEILYTSGHELYASPGDARWEQNPTVFPAAGLIGNGPFALYLRSIFATNDAVFTDRGAEQVAGRQAVRYDFQVPRMVSGHMVTVPGGRGIVGLKGAFWADPVSLDLLRLEIHADDIPVDLPVFALTSIVNYARVRIGEQNVLLPQSADLDLVEDNGRENRDAIEFTHCRAFHAESDLHFEAPPPIVANPPPASFSGTALGHPISEGTLPPGLPMVITLTTPVTAEAAVGTLIHGKVSGAIRLRGQELVPDGALVRGRIRRLERFSDASSDYYILGLEFNEIELRESVLRFFADLQKIESPGVEWLWSTSSTTTHRRVTATESTYLPDLPGVGAFFVRGTTVNFPAGSRLTWKTRALTR